LRLLRIFRFAAQHQFAIEDTTLNWVKQNAPLIKHSAVERVLSELVKILSAPDSIKTLREMFNSHLLQEIIPVSAMSLSSNLSICERWNAQVKNPVRYSTYLATPVTGDHHRGMLIQLYLLCFAHYFKDRFQDNKKSTVLSGFLSGRQFMSTQKKETPIIGALSRNEWSFFEKLSDVFLHVSPDKLKSPVEKSRFIRQAKPELNAVILVSRALYSAGSLRATDVYLEQLQQIEALWLQPKNPVAHPQLFLTGHEIAKLLNQKPGPQIGQVINQLLDAQALSLVSDYESAVDYVKGLSTNDGE
jgi:tRNA nucleotidyltransferase/poly(A) polymerase